MQPDSILLSFDSPDRHWRVVIEDDHRVAYAYLLEDGKIVGDVYQARNPAGPAWRNRTATRKTDVTWSN